MNIKNFYTSGNSGNKDLYDRLFFSELGLTEITNNDEVMIQFTNKLDELNDKVDHYKLFSIDIKTTHNIILICKSKNYGSQYNFCYILNEPKSIDTGTSFTVEQEVDEDIYQYIRDVISSNGRLDENDVVHTIVTKTMLGYRINKKFVNEIIETLTKFDNDSKIEKVNNTTILNIYNNCKQSIRTVKNEINKKFHDLKSLYELPFKNEDTINLEYIIGYNDELTRYNSYNYRNPIIVCKIENVFNFNSKRIMTYTAFDGTSTYKNSISTRITTDSKELYHKSDNSRVINLHSISYLNSCISNLDYNYLDKGRYIIILGDGYYYKKMIILQDPMIKELSVDDINAEVNLIVDKAIKENINTHNTNLEIVDDNKKRITLELHKYVGTSSTLTYKDMQRALKSMNNEYNYIIKKNKSEGSDIKITDNLSYIHSSGKLEYSDFVIETDFEIMKANVYNLSKELMLKFFRKELTEDQIIIKLTDYFYSKLDDIIQTTGFDTSFSVKFNNSVNVLIEIAKGEANFSYINDNRVNRNEISSILREISCYTSQESADKFIDNVCKKGLSVFIGISSGYFYDNKFYKFKTSEKSSEYIMNIDGIDINVKGKKVFNTLFSIAFKNERDERNARTKNSDMINNHVFGNVRTKFDYIKYKIMIDKSYEIFIGKSKEFLDKKVLETSAEHVQYFSKDQNKIYDGIKVKGSSGREYVIAYNLKESFVFMSPVHKTDLTEVEDKDVYEDGTYICMIDQSKMKATVGYDTVVSKLLSLKHDSVIASTIYNLEDELNK